MRFTLLKHFGDVVCIFEVIVSFAGDGGAGVLGLAATDSSCGIASAMQEVALGAPEDIG